MSTTSKTIALGQVAQRLSSFSRQVGALKKALSEGIPANPQAPGGGTPALTAAEVRAALSAEDIAYLDGIIAKHDELTSN